MISSIKISSGLQEHAMESMHTHTHTYVPLKRNVCLYIQECTQCNNDDSHN